MRVVYTDDDGWHVVSDSGKVLALFQGSPDTQRRHAEAWVSDEFDREQYESDIAREVGWTGQHVLKQRK